jgi:hypothetical protein
LIEVLCVRLQDCDANIGFARVVGGQHKFPIAELGVKIMEVSSGSISCLEKIKAIIANLVHTQPIAAGGIRHQLPKTARSFGGERCGASAALNQNYRSQIDGHSMTYQNGINGWTQQVQPQFRGTQTSLLQRLRWLLPV